MIDTLQIYYDGKLQHTLKVNGNSEMIKFLDFVGEFLNGKMFECYFNGQLICVGD